MFKDWFYDGKGVISFLADVILFGIWLGIKVSFGFSSGFSFGTLIIIMVITPMVIYYIANNFTEKGKEAKEIVKQASKLRREQNKEEAKEKAQTKEIKKNEKLEQYEIFAKKVSSIIDEVKKKDIKYYKIICLYNNWKYFSYAWVENEKFNLLLDKKSYDTPDKDKFNENGLITCNVKNVALTNEYSSYTSTTQTDAHVSVGGAIVGGVIGGTAGAILGGQKPATTKTTTESEDKYFLYLNQISIEIDIDSLPFIKDLIKGLKVIEKRNGKVYNEDDE